MEAERKQGFAINQRASEKNERKGSVVREWRNKQKYIKREQVTRVFTLAVLLEWSLSPRAWEDVRFR